MKPVSLIPAAALALWAFSSAAGAMSTVPYSTKPLPDQNGLVPNYPDGVANPYASPNAFSPYRATGRNAERNRPPQGFLNADPFDPNSVVNSYERKLYANPYPYDPIYNPYGQSGSRYAPMAPNIPMGQGMPYRR